MTRQDVPANKPGAGFERLLTSRETADRLRVSLSWLAKARMQGDGPFAMPKKPWSSGRKLIFASRRTRSRNAGHVCDSHPQGFI